MEARNNFLYEQNNCKKGHELKNEKKLGKK